MTPKRIFETIWEKALQHQDKREDKKHAEITLYYAKKLLETEKGDEKIVIPAIILHDIGWSKLPKEESMIIFDPKASKEEKLEIRYKHQEEGVKLARQLLQKIDYPEELTRKILEIISQHDTREGFISKEDGIVRDADKLWRYSKEGLEADMRRIGFSFDERCGQLYKRIAEKNFFCTDSAKKIALKELERRKGEHKR